MKTYDNCDYCQNKVGDTRELTKCSKGHAIYLKEDKPETAIYYGFAPMGFPCKDKILSTEDKLRLEYISVNKLHLNTVINDAAENIKLENYVMGKLQELEDTKPKPEWIIIINSVTVKTTEIELSYDELHNIIGRYKKGSVRFNRKGTTGFLGKVEKGKSIGIENGLIFNIK